MAFAQGSRSTLSFKEEATFGTTPAGNFQNLPFTTHSLNLTKDRVAGTDIQADRMPRVDRHGNRVVGGDIVADLRHAEFDVLMQSALMSDNDFATGFTAGDGSTTVTNIVQTPVGPRTYTEEIAGTPGQSVTIPSKFISIPQSDKAVNRGYRTQKRTKKIEYDKISIGGVTNPRNTTTIETDRNTDRVQNDLNDLKDSFDAAKDGFISLIERFDNVYSQRQYIN